MENPSSHMELAEGDGIVLFNDQPGSLQDISFSRRLKHLANTAGAGSERQSLRARSSTMQQKECQILDAETASGEKFSRLLLPQCEPSTLGVSYMGTGRCC